MTPDLTSLPAWAQGSAAGWTRAGEALVLPDMAAVTPAATCSRKGAPGRWRLIPYEAGGLSGNAIWASLETNAPPVQLPLPTRGWHAIYVGLFSTVLTPCKVWLSLQHNPAAHLRASQPSGGPYWSIEEVFFRVAELDGDALQIAQQSSGHASGAGVAYVKLVPLTPAEAEGFKTDRAQRGTRTMAATSDGYSFLWQHRPTTEPELRREIERFRDTDFGTLLLHLGGADLVNYPSRVGRMFGDGVRDFVEPGQRYAAESVRELAARRINPTRVWIDAAHEIGMKVHVGIRPALWQYYEPHGEFFASDFYAQHPQWRCVDRDGAEVARMSWAVPEVRAHLVAVLAEAVAFGADGAHIVFNRGFPMTLYEEPAAALFRARHGSDMRGCDDADPRVRQLWSDQCALFMRETRAMLDAEARRRGGGRRLELSACVLGSEAQNMQYGLDVRRLVDEGLLDAVYVYPYDFGATDRRFDVAWFHGVCAPRGVRVVPMFSSPVIDPQTLAGSAREAQAFYRDGADGIAIWDPHMTTMGVWLAMCRFGHRDELAALAARGEPRPTFLPVHRLGGTVMDGRFPPYWGG